MGLLTCQKCGSGPFGETASYCFSCGNPLENGGLLNNKYRLVRIIGEGGLGFVYLAEEVGFYNRRCALKRIGPPKTDLDPEYAQREVEILVKLNNRGLPGIPEIYESFIINRSFFVAMKLIEGRNLLDWAKQAKPAWKVIVEQIAQVSRILANLHTLTPPVIHADIKPENLLLDEFDQLWLVDFGFSRPLAITASSGSSYLPAGSIKFTPWEQWQKRPTPAADVYALAMTLYYMLVGEPLFNRRTNARLDLLVEHPGLVDGDYFNPGWPLPLKEALLKATLEDPEQRLSARELMKMLSDALDEVKQTGKASSPAEAEHPKSQIPAGPQAAAAASAVKAPERDSKQPPTVPFIFIPPEVAAKALAQAGEAPPGGSAFGDDTAKTPIIPVKLDQSTRAAPNIPQATSIGPASALKPPTSQEQETPSRVENLPASVDSRKRSMETGGIQLPPGSGSRASAQNPPKTIPRTSVIKEPIKVSSTSAGFSVDQMSQSQVGRSFELRDGRKLYRPRDLADLAERNGIYAIELLTKGVYTEWLRADLGQIELAARVEQVLKTAADGIEALEDIVGLLMPEAPIPRLLYQPNEIDLGIISRQPKKVSLYIGKAAWGFIGARVMSQATWIEVDPTRLAISGQGYHRLAVIIHPDRIPAFSKILTSEIVIKSRLQYYKIKVSATVEGGNQLGRILSRPFSK